jgi:hypothetical protein
MVLYPLIRILSYPITPALYLRAETQNADTLAVMSHIPGFDASTQSYLPECLQRPMWPGKSYKVDDSNAQALLGVPNGKGGRGRLRSVGRRWDGGMWSGWRFSLRILRIGKSRICRLDWER